MSEMMVVKIQRAIEPPDGPYLIYDESRQKINGFVTELPESVRKLIGHRLRVYALASLRDDGKVQISSLIGDQEW